MWRVVNNVYEDDEYRQYYNRRSTITVNDICAHPNFLYRRNKFNTPTPATVYRIQEESLEYEDYGIAEFFKSLSQLNLTALRIVCKDNCSAIVKVYGGSLTKINESLTTCKWYLLYLKKNDDVSNNSELNLVKPQINCRRMIYAIRIHYDYRKLANSVSKPLINVFGFGTRRQFKTVNNKILHASKKRKRSAIESGNEEKLDYLSILPYEIIEKIFAHFDLRTLARTAQVCCRFNDIITKTDIFYYNLDFQPYWNLMSDDVLDRFMDKTKKLKKLNLCWFNENDHLINNSKLEEFLNGAKNTLTHLYIDGKSVHPKKSLIKAIFACKGLVELHLRTIWLCPIREDTNRRDYDYGWVKPDIIEFKNLRILDLSFSSINDTDLITILSQNRKLEHLILDSLSLNIENYLYDGCIDRILQKLIEFDINLKTWSSWNTYERINKVSLFQFHTNLEELRLCSGFEYFEDNESDDDDDYNYYNLPATTFNFFSKCPRLKRLSLSFWRRIIRDEHLTPIFENAEKLEQVNISELNSITAKSVEGFLKLENLKLLNIVNCTHETISLSKIEEWRKEYPQVKFIR